MYLCDESGEYEFEVDEADCELEPDGSGFWLLAAEDEEDEDFYEFCD
jgi:hypothetical protein